MYSFYINVLREIAVQVHTHMSGRASGTFTATYFHMHLGSRSHPQTRGLHRCLLSLNKEHAQRPASSAPAMRHWTTTWFNQEESWTWRASFKQMEWIQSFRDKSNTPRLKPRSESRQPQNPWLLSFLFVSQDESWLGMVLASHHDWLLSLQLHV